jgi:hypothetical protein
MEPEARAGRTVIGERARVAGAPLLALGERCAPGA